MAQYGGGQHYPPQQQQPQASYGGNVGNQQYAQQPQYGQQQQQQQHHQQANAYGQGYTQQPAQYDAAAQQYAQQAAPAAHDAYAQQPQQHVDPQQSASYGVSSAQANIDALEARDGVRFIWNEWPLTRVDQERAVFKLGALVTPLKPLATSGGTGVVVYEPVRCKQANCQGILSPWAQVDFRGKTWGCPFCGQHNAFPPHYAANITETNLPAELLPENTTIEYQLGRVIGPPVFLFVVDTILADEDLEALKDALQQAISLLPESALVGLITFGANIQVHEIGFHAAAANSQQQQQAPSLVCSKSYVFRGDRGVTPEKIFQMLGVGAPGAGAHAAGRPGAANPAAPHLQNMPPGVERFLVPVRDVASALESIIQDLPKDPWPTPRDQRPNRCTGVAMSLATVMLEKMCPKRGARIMMFLGGPPTIGEGAVAELTLATPIRSHADIEKGKAPLFKPAKEFYEKIAHRCVENCFTMDIFVASLDQTGLLEMKSCVELTGGYVVLADTFEQSVFRESLQRVFTRHPDTAHECDRGELVMGLAGTMEIVTSPEVRIKGAIGPICSLNKKGPNVSDVEVGQGGTYAWRICAMDQSSTIAVFLDTDMKGSPQTKLRYVQFITHYQHANGRARIRVTTTGGPWQQDPHRIQSIAHSFDQLAAVVCMARVAVHRIETEAPLDIIRFMDRSLIKFCTQFAQYSPGDANSFSLMEEFNMFPQFLFHLRRSPFLQIFNTSCDESCYYRLTLLRENCTNSIVMIQPALCSYSMANPTVAEPVLLDSASIKPDVILILDTFFHVIVWHGESIAAWREQGFQDNPGYEGFRAMLAQPKDDAHVMMQGRIPQPRYIVCDQNKSQSRFLMSKVNPSSTHNTQDIVSTGGTQVFTDDANLNSFMAHLRNIATANNN